MVLYCILTYTLRLHSESLDVRDNDVSVVSESFKVVPNCPLTTLITSALPKKQRVAINQNICFSLPSIVTNFVCREPLNIAIATPCIPNFKASLPYYMNGLSTRING